MRPRTAEHTHLSFTRKYPPQDIDALKKCCLVWDSHSCTRCTETFNIWINIWSLSAGNFSIKTILWESHSREVKETLNNCLLGTKNFLHRATTAQKEKLLCLSCPAFESCWSSLADEHNTSPKSTRRHAKLDKFIFGTPWLPDSLCKHWFASSVWNLCRWVADVPPRETFSGEERGETDVFAG